MSLDNLPVEWCLIQLGHIVNVNSGVGFPKEFQGRTDQPIPVYKVSDVSYSVLNQNGMLQTANNSVSQGDLDKLKGHLFNEGSTLFAKIGEAVKLNRRAYVKRKGLADNNVMGVTPLENVSNKYIFYFLHTIDLALHSRSTTIPSIRKSDIEELPISFPALAEQQEIVRQLDIMLAQVEQIKARLDAIPAILKKFRQSVLADAVSGKLTEEWRQASLTKESVDSFLDIEKLRKDNYLTLNPDLKKKKSSIECQIDADYLFEIPNSWAFTSWGKISEWITYGFTKPMPKSESGKKLLTAKDVQNFNIKIEDANFTTEEAYISLSDKDRPQQGDLLITKDGTIGRSGLVRTDIPFCINQSVAVCWLRSTGMNKDYLEYLANSEFTQKFVFDKAQGMAIQHLSIIDFAKCPVPVPPKEEQDVIVIKLDALYKYSKSIENLVQSAQRRVNLLTQSILAKAFSGELTAEWREQHQDLITGVNSAESLLAKIQAEREASKPVKKAKKVK